MRREALWVGLIISWVGGGLILSAMAWPNLPFDSRIECFVLGWGLMTVPLYVIYKSQTENRMQKPGEKGEEKSSGAEREKV
jgi:hypothetical protein